MKLFAFRFHDRSYGCRFIAIVHHDKEQALEAALDLLGDMPARERAYHKRWAHLSVDNTEVEIAPGAFVDASWEE